MPARRPVEGGGTLPLIGAPSSRLQSKFSADISSTALTLDKNGKMMLVDCSSLNSINKCDDACK